MSELGRIKAASRRTVLICGQSLYVVAIEASLRHMFPAVNIERSETQPPSVPGRCGNTLPDVLIVETPGGDTRHARASRVAFPGIPILVIDATANSLAQFEESTASQRTLDDLPRAISDILCGSSPSLAADH